MATCHHHRTDKCHLQMDNLIQMVHNQTDSHIQTANSLINHILDNNIQWINKEFLQVVIKHLMVRYTVINKAAHSLDNNIQTAHNQMVNLIQMVHNLINHTLDNNIRTVHNHNHTLDNNIRTVHNHNHTLDNNIQTVHNLDSNIPIKNIRMPVLIGCIWIRKNVLLMAVHGVET